MPITLDHYLVLSAIVFAIGLFGALSRRSAIAVLLSIELMFNAVNITLVAFTRYVNAVSGSQVIGAGPAALTGQLTGQVFALFTIAVAAAEAAVALAIILALFRTRRTSSVEDANQLKW